MAYLGRSFIDSLIYIYDNENKFITKTIVTGHNRDEMYIEVPKGLEDIKPKSRLQLLIIHPEGASELNGSLKSVRQGIYEISIYGEQQRDVRASTRRTLNASAVISDMVTDNDSENLPAPIQITVEDLSTTGILIDTNDRRFELGTFFEIVLELNGKRAILFSEAVREQKSSDDTYKYGCKLYFVD